MVFHALKRRQYFCVPINLPGSTQINESFTSNELRNIVTSAAEDDGTTGEAKSASNYVN
jgi:hypothetical protein